jgi:signal transduction histidine kinase
VFGVCAFVDDPVATLLRVAGTVHLYARGGAIGIGELTDTGDLHLLELDRVETSGDMTPTIGSHTLLLQLTHPKSMVLTVANTGEKLTPRLVSTLAEPFQRGTERTRTDHAGVGLGLAIVQSITRAHDGTLALDARPDGGLRVTVELPAAPPTT